MEVKAIFQVPTGLILNLIPLPLCVLSLWSPPFPLRGPFFSSIILLPLFSAHFYPFTRDAGLRYGLMLPWVIYFGTVAKILFCIPEQTFWRLGHERQEAMKMKRWGWQKSKWSLALLCSTRGIGWNFQVKGIPASEKGKETRAKFVWKRVTIVFCLFLGTDLSSSFLKRIHFPCTGEMSTRELSLGTRVLVLLIIGVQSYCSTSMFYQWAATFGALLGLSEPKDWPPIFGDITKATTLRYLWGDFWHQDPQILTTFTHGLINILHIPRHTIASSLATLLGTFTLSGLYHSYASYSLAYPTPGSIHATTFDRFWRFFIFFELQVLGIVIEDVRVRYFRRWRGKTEKEHVSYWERALGYLWVASWLLGAGRVLLDTYLKTEMGLVGMRRSLVEFMLKTALHH